MSRHQPNAELESLLIACIEGNCDAAQSRRMVELVGDNPAMLAAYVESMRIHAMLQWRYSAPPNGQSLGDLVSGTPEGVQMPQASHISGVDTISPGATPHATAGTSSRIPGFVSAVYGPAGYFSSGWPVAYLLATVIFGIGLAIGALVHVSHPSELVKHDSSSANRRPSESRPLTDGVARITGAVDCVWEGAAASNHESEIRLGDTLALRSGLLEITYNTGAKVILQGPVAYKVESADGGFLSTGKLTARLEKRSEVRSQRSGSANQKSEIRNHTFAIRTPTALVTDLGTEFGVEVSKGGLTKTCVFAGSVRVETRGAAPIAAPRTLVAGQAVQVDSRSEVIDISKGRHEFIRTMPGAKSPAGPELIGQVDYSDTWTANSPTRSGSYLILQDPTALQVEQRHGNPPRSWVFSRPTALTTWPYDNSPVPWPGHEVFGSKSGFTEAGIAAELYFGIEYGLRDDFVVQFDAVQTDDRVNITIGDAPATIYGDRQLSVFFRTPGREFPQVGLHTKALGEIDTGIRSGVPEAWRWHNYAARFNLREKRITVWVDRRLLGEVDLTLVPHSSDTANRANWSNLRLSNRFVTVGAYRLKEPSRTWTDNFRVGSPADAEKGGKDRP